MKKQYQIISRDRREYEALYYHDGYAVESSRALEWDDFETKFKDLVLNQTSQIDLYYGHITEPYQKPNLPEQKVLDQIVFEHNAKFNI